MSEHRHDPDLVLALAGGDLPAAETRQAAAEIAGCSRCASDLEAQRTALAALAALADDPAARLTELESRRLLRALHDALALPIEAPRATPASPSRSGRGPWAVAAVAAVVLGVVVAGNALRSMTDGGDDATDEVAAAEVAEDESGGLDDRVAATTAAPELAAAPAPADTTSLVQGSSTTAAADAQDTAAPLTSGAAPMTLADLTSVWDEVAGADGDGEQTPVGEALAVATDLAAALDTRLAAALTREQGADEGEAAGPCVGAAEVFVDAPADVAVVGSLDVVELGPTVLTVSVLVDGTTRLVLHDPATCAVVVEVTPEPGHP